MYCIWLSIKSRMLVLPLSGGWKRPQNSKERRAAVPRSQQPHATQLPLCRGSNACWGLFGKSSQPTPVLFLLQTGTGKPLPPSSVNSLKLNLRPKTYAHGQRHRHKLTPAQTSQRNLQNRARIALWGFLIFFS